MRIIPRQREADIFAAAFTAAPSYDGPEIWTLIDHIAVPGKPVEEHLAVARSRREYDRGVQTLRTGGKALVGHLVYSGGDDPREFAQRVYDSGAPLRSVVNAWNLARLSRGEPTAHIYLSDREYMLYAFAEGILIDFLEERSHE